MKLELNQVDLENLRIIYCDKDGRVVDNPTIMELVNSYASKYNIRFDRVYTSLEKVARE